MLHLVTGAQVNSLTNILNFSPHMEMKHSTEKQVFPSACDRFPLHSFIMIHPPVAVLVTLSVPGMWSCIVSEFTEEDDDRAANPQRVLLL